MRPDTTLAFVASCRFGVFAVMLDTPDGRRVTSEKRRMTNDERDREAGSYDAKTGNRGHSWGSGWIRGKRLPGT